MTFEEKRKRKRTSVVDKNTASKTAVFAYVQSLYLIYSFRVDTPFTTISAIPAINALSLLE